ncbi:MAG TPA: DUF4229 domain-containing protein [Mycobacteriales bacterium]|nr:DUF4229 domain-containing protein [Mycobacteriales bacterium]
MGPFLRYNGLRLLLLGGCLGAALLAGLRGAPLLLVGLLGSGVLSYFVLARQRTAMVGALTQAAARRQDARVRAAAGPPDGIGAHPVTPDVGPRG